MLRLVVFLLQILAHQDLIITESDVYHINPVIKEEFGMIKLLNVFAQTMHSSMEYNVLDVLSVSCMQMVAVSALKEHSLMEFNVLQEQLTDALVFLILIGTELTVFVSQDLLRLTINAIVKV